MSQIEKNRNKIGRLLLKTGIDTERVVRYLDGCDFFKAPCSGGNHLCVEGGLAEHSLNVYEYMKKLASTWKVDVPEKSIILTSIFHDLGKIGDYGKPNYVENLVRSKTKNKETGEYDMVKSSVKPYKTNPELKYIPHEIRSVMICRMLDIPLNEDEEYAILYHNGNFVPSGRDWKPDKLSMILHFADLYVSREVEGKGFVTSN